MNYSFRRRYDPSTQRWTRVTSMGTKRLGVAVAVLDGFLYAIGGSDGQCPLNTGNGSSFANLSVVDRDKKSSI